MSTDAFVEHLLCGCHNVQDVLRAIEHDGPRLSSGQGAIALHVLAVSAAPLPKEERRQLIAAPSINKLMLQLGTQLGGATEADLHGMNSILWALALLEQADCPLLQGLVNRLMLHITRGDVSAPQLMVSVQALAQLKLVSGSIGAALAARVQARVHEFSAAELGTLARVLAEALGSGAELLLRDVLAKRADAFLSVDFAAGQPSMQAAVHAGASLLLALSAAAMNPEPPVEFVGAVCEALQRYGIDPPRLPLHRLSELMRALQLLSASENFLALALDQELRFRVGRIEAHQLEAAVEELQTHGPGLAPAVTLVRERQAQLQEQLRVQLGTAPDERAVLRLLHEGPMVQAPQLVVALARLAELVQACPDPEAWAASLTASRDFAFVIQKVELFLPTMDALQLREAICALASLRVRQPALLMALGEQVSSHLHVLNSTDAARCLWAFCTLSLLQAPAYPKMMRSLEKHLASLPAELLCQLVQAVVPLGRGAACARLLPKLCDRLLTRSSSWCDALVAARPTPPFELLLPTARELCARVALPEPLLVELRNVVASECSGEGEGSLSGNLTNPQLVMALWLFVRHLPLLQAQSPFSPLTPLLPPMIERLLLLITDLSSLSSEHLCDVLHVLARLGRGGALLTRLVAQVETRLERGQLRTSQMLEAAWALYELHPGFEHPAAKALVAEAGRRVRSEGPERCSDALRVLSRLPMRRPLPLAEPLARALDPRALEPDQLVKVFDALARLRYSEPKLLGGLEARAHELLARTALHEAQAACILEALALLGFTGGMQLVPALLTRLQAAPLLLPHTVAAALHGAAQLRLVPVAPCGAAELLQLMEASALQPDLPDLATCCTSLIELGQHELAAQVLQGVGGDAQEQVLQQYEHALLKPLLLQLNNVGVGVRLPLHVAMLTEVALMLQLEAPPALGLGLPAELCMQANATFQQQQQLAKEPPSPMLRDVAHALGALGLPHQLQVCFATPQAQSSFLLDVALAPEGTGGVLIAILVHPPTHYSSSRELLGRVRLRQRLLKKQGWAVVDVSAIEWNELRNVDEAVAMLRKLLQPHMQR